MLYSLLTLLVKEAREIQVAEEVERDAGCESLRRLIRGRSGFHLVLEA